MPSLDGTSKSSGTTVERLRWHAGCRSLVALQRRPRPSPCRLSGPVASAPAAALRWGWSEDCTPIWHRHVSGASPDAVARDYREARSALATIGVEVPAVLATPSSDSLLLRRPPWAAPGVEPERETVVQFVEGALVDPLATGRLIIAGTSHVGAGGGLVVEDIAGIGRIESVDRELLARLLTILIDRDLAGLRSLIEAATWGWDDQRAWVAKRCASGLAIEWNALAFTLALRDIATVLVTYGATSGPVVALVADELAHRMDLAHAHPTYRVLLHSLDVADLLDRAG